MSFARLRRVLTSWTSPTAPEVRPPAAGMATPKRVVFTCLFGDYETLNEQPVARRSNIDFVCFTNTRRLRSRTWSIQVVDGLGIDDSRESRRPKVLPHLFLGDYDQSLYIDNSVTLKDDFAQLFDALDRSEENFASFRHPWRDCIYDEAEEIIRGSVDDEARVREQMDFYRRNGYPEHAGLNTNAVLLRRHNMPDVVEHSVEWFSHILRYSKRDQLSFNYTARRRQLRFKTLEMDFESNAAFVRAPAGPERLPRAFTPANYLWLHPDVARSGMDPVDHYRRYGRSEGRAVAYHHPIELNRLANKYGSDKGNLRFNRHFYARVYERYLATLRDELFTFVEIGLLRLDTQLASADKVLRDAPSLRMWAEYFSTAQIHGVDIRECSLDPTGRITLTVADQSDRSDLARVVSRCQHAVEVIVDDGSHVSHHQQISLGFLFPHLAPAGLYFIEDLRHQPAGKELPDALKTLDFLRDIQAGKRPASPHLTPEENERLLDQIDSIEFYDSMDYATAGLGADSLAVIRKRP